MPTPLEYPTDFRARPECYEIGTGETGVFRVQPYKSELLPLWTFKTPEAARASAEALWAKYEAYRADEDFVGMDVARKFLQMGFTRAMRYARFPGGRRLAPDGTPREPEQWADAAKRRSSSRRSGTPSAPTPSIRSAGLRTRPASARRIAGHKKPVAARKQPPALCAVPGVSPAQQRGHLSSVTVCIWTSPFASSR